MKARITIEVIPENGPKNTEVLYFRQFSVESVNIDSKRIGELITEKVRTICLKSCDCMDLTDNPSILYENIFPGTSFCGD